MFNKVVLIFVLTFPLLGFAQVENLASQVTWECTSDSTQKELYKFQRYVFSIHTNPIDTLKYTLGFKVDNDLSSEKFNTSRPKYWTTVFTDSIEAKWCLIEKETNKVVFRDSLKYHVPMHPQFDLQWLSLPNKKLPKWEKDENVVNELVSNYRQYKLVNELNPHFEVMTWMEEPIALDHENSAKPTLIYFTSSSCGPCILEKASLDSLSRKYEGQVRFIMIYHDISKKDKKNLADRNTQFEFVLDKKNELHDLYYVKAWPTKFLIHDNHVKYSFSGGIIFHEGKMNKRGEINPTTLSYHEHLFKTYFDLE